MRLKWCAFVCACVLIFIGTLQFAVVILLGATIPVDCNAVSLLWNTWRLALRAIFDDYVYLVNAFFLHVNMFICSFL